MVDRNAETVIIRDATPADLPAVVDIYNALLATTTYTWTETAQTLEARRAWYERHHERGYPLLVAEGGDGTIAGFAAYESFRGDGKWPGYRFTVEHTIHVREARWGAGVGRQLLEALIERARSAGIHVMVGAIDASNQPSIVFHERLGFTEVARMPEIGTKFGQWLDLVLMQRRL